MAAANKLSQAEWAEAKRSYEEDGWSFETIADYFGSSYAAVYQHSKKYGWVKPKSQTGKEVRERIRAVQERATMEVELRVAEGVSNKLDQLVGEAREDAIREANAQEVSRIMLLHRTGATRMREMLGHLFGELQLTSLRPDDLQHLVEVVAKARAQEGDTEREVRRIEAQTLEAFQRLLGLDNRADIAKKLVDSMIKAIEIERRVYGIKDDVTEGDIAKALKELADAAD